jgi:predicted phage tail protein
MDAFHRFFGKKNKHSLQTMALVALIVVSVLLYYAAGAGAGAATYALLGVMAVAMGLTMAVS